jgi:hypothetical protein
LASKHGSNKLARIPDASIRFMDRIFFLEVKADTRRRPNKMSCHSNPQAQGRTLRKSPAMRQINDEMRKGATKLDTRIRFGQTPKRIRSSLTA